MVVVDVRVAEDVHEVAHFEVADLRDHVRQCCVRRDVEGHTDEQVGGTLVQLAAEPALGHVELEEGVTRRQRHLRDLPDVPRRDDVPARIGIGPDRFDDLVDLVDVAAVRRRPTAPLIAVDGPELAGLGVGPIVPDMHIVLVQPGHVRGPLQEPQQFPEDPAGVYLLRGEQREANLQIEPHLVAEDAACPGSGAVVLVHTVVEHVGEQVVVLLHESASWWGAASTSRSTGPMARTALPRWLMASFSWAVSSALVRGLPDGDGGWSSARKMGS